MKISALIILTLLLGGCSGSDTPAVAPAIAAPEKPAVSGGRDLKSGVDALARAQETETVIHDAAEQQRKDIDASQ